MEFLKVKAGLNAKHFRNPFSNMALGTVIVFDIQPSELQYKRTVADNVANVLKSI
jgi:hypothetical protein